MVLGGRALIECAVDGDNPITVEWSRNGRTLNGDAHARLQMNRITVSAAAGNRGRVGWGSRIHEGCNRVWPEVGMFVCGGESVEKGNK